MTKKTVTAKLSPEEVVNQEIARSGLEYRFLNSNPPNAHRDFVNADILRFPSMHPDNGPLRNPPFAAPRYQLLKEKFGNQPFTVGQVEGLFTALGLHQRRKTIRWFIQHKWLLLERQNHHK